MTNKDYPEFPDDSEFPYRIIWEQNQWHRLSANGSIQDRIERIYGTYPPFQIGLKQSVEAFESRARDITRGYEGRFFCYNLSEVKEGIVPIQFSDIFAGDYAIKGRNLEPVSYPFNIALDKQFPITDDFIPLVIAEAKKRGLIDLVNTFRRGESGRVDDHFIFPIQLYRKM